MPTTKQCSTCKVTKPVLEFYKDKRRKDGLFSRCKACHLATAAKWAASNRDRVNARRRETSAENPGRDAARQRKWRKENRDNHLASRRGYHARNKERENERHRKWAKENQDLMIEYANRRRARIAGATVEEFTKEDLYRAWDDAGMYACVYCDGPYEHADHVVPLALGGAHSIENLVPSCADCNLAKGALDPWEFVESILNGSRRPKWDMSP